MNACCLICNTKAVLSLRNAASLFGEHSTVPTGKKLSDVVSEILARPIKEKDVHSNLLCKKCFKTCSEYESMKVRMQSIKELMQDQYATFAKNPIPISPEKSKDEESPAIAKETPAQSKFVGKKLVLPKTKLQPVPVGMLPDIWRNRKLNLSKTLITTPTKPLTTVITTKSDPDTTLENVEQTDDTDIENLITTKPDDSMKNDALLEFDIDTLPKDFLSSSSVIKKEKDGDMSKPGDAERVVVENKHDHQIEIDEECALTVVPVTTANEDSLMFEVESIKTEARQTADNQLFNLNVLPSLDTSAADTDKYILRKLDTNEEVDSDETTIVVENDLNGDNLLRMVGGQKLIYGGNKISFVLPFTVGEQNDNGQDSNDESQIELQVSGDEETANAIIAAAQEQGGAFIKVESGEMYRVKSVQSKTEMDSSSPLEIVVKDGDKFKCLLCEKKDKTDLTEKTYKGDGDSMMRHLKMKHDARIYICQICGVIMRKRTDYTTHIAEHSTVSRGVHRCAMCTRTYTTRALLAEHMLAHSGARPYACTRCGKHFASKYTHHAHLKTHEDRPRPFKCSQCGKSFLSQQNLNQHEKTHSSVKDFICKICNKAFSTQHNLEVHGVVHSGNKPFVCGICDKAFARRAEVRDHMRIHTGERPFSCDICNATFTQRSNLYSHKRATHLDDKRYHCTQCTKKFKRRRLLEYHIKASHTGERPLICEICNASFVYPEHYKKHIRIHSGERPYVCEICGKGFSSRDNRNTHRFVHSDKKPYECLACGAGYMRKQLLLAHMHSAGHIAESIVVNQPRVTKVIENGITTKIFDVRGIETKSISILPDTIFETTEELELNSDEKCSEKSQDEDISKLLISGDTKLIMQDVKSPTINLVQENVNPLILQNLTTDATDGALVETVDMEQLGDQTQIVANDESGGIVRLIQIKLPDGNNGWVAINPFKMQNSKVIYSV